MTSFIGGSSVPSDRYPARLDVRLIIPARELFGAAPNAEIPNAGEADWLNRPARAEAPDPHWIENGQSPARCRLTHVPGGGGALDRLGQKLDDSELGKAALF